MHEYHTKKDKTEDIKKVIGQLEESKVLEDIPNRYHKGFTRFSSNYMKKINKEELEVWMKQRLKIKKIG